MRKRRLAAIACVAAALAPGTFVRTPLAPTHPFALTLTPLDDLPDTAEHRGFTRQMVWELTGNTIDFGGFSALLEIDGGDTLRAFSDRGTKLTFPAPGQEALRPPTLAEVWDRGPLSNELADIEAATHDAETGEYWLAFESTHSLLRLSLESEYLASAVPPEWQDWPVNAGAEALALLPDGRFLVLPESAKTGLLYPADPTTGAEPLTFRLTLPDGFSPTDMTTLPDGRVLVLLRKLDWAYPPFTAALALADPRSLDEGDTLAPDVLLSLDTILPRENWEALTFAGIGKGGIISLWLMSDDNLASFQRTLLARIDWDPDFAHEKAREEP